MGKIINVEGLLMDYGGTIDTNGRHWAAVLFEQYHNHGIPLDRDDFYEAYVFAERKMALEPIIKAHFTFDMVLQVKVAVQMEYLNISYLFMSKGMAIVDACCVIVESCIEEAKPVLKLLKQRYKIFIVSNFYGNLESVLSDYNLLDYFDGVIESARVGVRKPDAAIYQLGIHALKLPANSCGVIGDSYSKDIVPGKECGCTTVWIQKQVWDDSELASTGAADHVISGLNSLKDLLL